MTTGEFTTPSTSASEYEDAPLTLQEQVYAALLTIIEVQDVEGRTYSTPGNHLYTALNESTPTGLKTSYMLSNRQSKDSPVLMSVVAIHRTPEQILRGDHYHFDIVEIEGQVEILRKVFTEEGPRKISTPHYEDPLSEDLLSAIIADADAALAVV